MESQIHLVGITKIFKNEVPVDTKLVTLSMFKMFDGCN